MRSAVASAAFGNSSALGHSPAASPHRGDRVAATRPRRHRPPAPLLPARWPHARVAGSGLAPSAHPAAPGQAAASRPGGPKGGGAAGELPAHRTGLARGRGGRTAPHRTASHRVASPPASLAPALPALSLPSPNTSLNFQPRPLPLQQERGQARSLPAAGDPPPRLPAVAAWLSLPEPRGEGTTAQPLPASAPSPAREAAARRKGSGNPFQRSSRRRLTRGAGAQPCRTTAGTLRTRLRSPVPGGAGKRILGRDAGQRPKPVSRTSF